MKEAQEERSDTQQELSAAQEELSAAQQARLSMPRVTALSRISPRTNFASRNHQSLIHRTISALVTPAVTLFVTLGRHLSVLIGVRR